MSSGRSTPGPTRVANFPIFSLSQSGKRARFAHSACMHRPVFTQYTNRAGPDRDRDSGRSFERRTSSRLDNGHCAGYPKKAENKRSPSAKARPQPKAASAASATNSRKFESVQGAFHLLKCLAMSPRGDPRLITNLRSESAYAKSWRRD
jgi:hypothetical protein